MECQELLPDIYGKETTTVYFKGKQMREIGKVFGSLVVAVV